MSSAHVSSLFNGTLTLHRLSPLHHSASAAPLVEENAAVHSRRLSEALRGDTLRGVKVLIHEDPTSTTLKSCQWRSLRAEAVLGSQEPDTLGLEGLEIELDYGKHRYIALALRYANTIEVQRPGETYLPLLLTRMPSGIRSVLLDYLTTTFDTRIEPLRLSSHFMENVLESSLAKSTAPDSTRLEKDVKGIQLVLGFRIPIAPELKSLVIDIRKEDVIRFLRKGEHILRQRTSDRANLSRGLEARDDKPEGPFMAGVSRHIESQTALDMKHMSIEISRISCGVFALSADGKIKLMAPSAFDTAEMQPGFKGIRPVFTLLVQRLLDKSVFRTVA
ncbi:hypothetical protein MMC13_003146 [Lambiella insularis]|nr:hypothetical protein [Lambiella insularis]